MPQSKPLLSMIATTYLYYEAELILGSAQTAQPTVDSRRADKDSY